MHKLLIDSDGNVRGSIKDDDGLIVTVSEYENVTVDQETFEKVKAEKNKSFKFDKNSNKLSEETKEK